jgi:hypothetical protein
MMPTPATATRIEPTVAGPPFKSGPERDHPDAEQQKTRDHDPRVLGV